MSHAPYVLEDDPRPLLGLVVLQSDETIEDEFRAIFAPADVRLHITRIPSAEVLTQESLAQMEEALPRAAGLFPRAAAFDAVAFACTSGSSQIGPRRVETLIRSACHAKAVTNPLEAAYAALRRTGARRIGILSPYPADIAAALRSDFEAAGFDVPVASSFGEAIEANVVRISAASIQGAALDLAAGQDLEAVFLSCTNLRALEPIRSLSAALEIPVISSNTALAWHLADLAGLATPERLCLGRFH